jgi:hypothetical protein
MLLLLYCTQPIVAINLSFVLVGHRSFIAIQLLKLLSNQPVSRGGTYSTSLLPFEYIILLSLRMGISEVLNVVIP